MPPIELTISLIAALILGIALTFWGESLFRLWMIFMGAWAGYMISSRLRIEFELEQTAFIIITVVLSLALALFFWKAFKVSIFLAGFSLGAYIAWYFGTTVFGLNQTWSLLVVGLVFALIAGFLRNTFIIGSTSLTGGILLVSAIEGFVNNRQSIALPDLIPTINLGTTEQILMTLAPFLVAALGFYVQSRRHKNRPPRFFR